MAPDVQADTQVTTSTSLANIKALLMPCSEYRPLKAGAKEQPIRFPASGPEPK